MASLSSDTRIIQETADILILNTIVLTSEDIGITREDIMISETVALYTDTGITQDWEDTSLADTAGLSSQVVCAMPRIDFRIVIFAQSLL